MWDLLMRGLQVDDVGLYDRLCKTHRILLAAWTERADAQLIFSPRVGYCVLLEGETFCRYGLHLAACIGFFTWREETETHVSYFAA